MTKKNKKENGYALLELLFYISLFAVLVLVVINSMITMTRSLKETSIQSEFIQSGNIMERISREIRGSYDINSITATDLLLNTKDINGVNKTVEFIFSNPGIQLKENGVVTGNLNTSNITVTVLSFTQITTTKGKGVKIFLTLKANDDTLARTQNFYDTVVLRGLY